MQALELTRFTLDPAREHELLATRPQVLARLRKLPGFVEATLARVDERTWVDVILWESRAHAEAAIEQAPSIPELAPAFALPEQLLACEHADLVTT
jgi:heme-degrading monooxygenase HmoA